MTPLSRTWALPDIPHDEITSLARVMSVPEAVSAVYLVRGLHTPQMVHGFCDLRLDSLYDPFVLPDMEAAVERLCSALRNGERIMVFGDSDCDGLTATALLIIALQGMGGEVIYQIAQRLHDDFGLTKTAVQRAKSEGASLIITVDCGTHSFIPADYAKEVGIDLIITDHHEPASDGGLPQCVACVNPRRSDSTYPFPHLAGVGVALKLICGLAERMGCDQGHVADQLLDLVAIGTVADCSIMLGENRILTHHGCRRLNQHPRPGIKELLRSAGVRRADSEGIGFYLAPRLNAAYRMADPSVALSLLVEQDAATAKGIAQELCTINDKRKALQSRITNDVLANLPDRVRRDAAICIVDNEWHPGVIGLVANSLSVSMGKPAFVSTLARDGTVKGSCRSPEGVSVLELLASCSDILIGFGGHHCAAGFSVRQEHWEELSRRLKKHAAIMSRGQGERLLEIDSRLHWQDVNVRTYDAISRLAPFGNSNPEPLFLTEGLIVANSVAFGKENTHLKLTLVPRDRRDVCYQAVAWRNGHRIDDYANGTSVDLVYRLSLDEYRSNRSIMLVVEDMRPSD